MSWQWKTIVAIGEGHGDVTAVPALLRQWFRHKKLHSFRTPPEAVRATGSGALKAAHRPGGRLGVEYYVQIAARARPNGILIVLDADRECVDRKRHGGEKLGPELLRRARSVTPQIPISVVIANREYEAWSLAQLDVLKAAGVARTSMELPEGYRIEQAAGYKAKMRQMLGERYRPTVHQGMLTRHLVFAGRPAARSRSFRKLIKELQYLTQAALGLRP
jgi:hypothetical protein